jgi:hypothetical protein
MFCESHYSTFCESRYSTFDESRYSTFDENRYSMFDASRYLIFCESRYSTFDVSVPFRRSPVRRREVDGVTVGEDDCPIDSSVRTECRTDELLT